MVRLLNTDLIEFFICAGIHQRFSSSSFVLLAFVVLLVYTNGRKQVLATWSQPNVPAALCCWLSLCVVGIHQRKQVLATWSQQNVPAALCCWRSLRAEQDEEAGEQVLVHGASKMFQQLCAAGFRYEQRFVKNVMLS